MLRASSFGRTGPLLWVWALLSLALGFEAARGETDYLDLRERLDDILGTHVVLVLLGTEVLDRDPRVAHLVEPVGVESYRERARGRAGRERVGVAAATRRQMLDMMAAGEAVDRIARTVHIHPTVSELVPTLLQQLKPMA